MENKYGITLDGRMNEPIWDTIEAHTGFTTIKSSKDGGCPAPVDTVFKFLPCEDRIYMGIKALEPDGMESILATRNTRNSYNGHAIELFFSPTGDSYEFYQFVVTINGDIMTQYYAEGGNIRPDPYKPDWASAVHIGEDYWSVEVEIPLTAFYWTYQEKWSSKWLLNVTRDRYYEKTTQYSSWSPLNFGFHEPTSFRSVDGFPMRPAQDDVRIFSAVSEMQEETAEGYVGVMTVRVDLGVGDTFTFGSDRTECKTVALPSGSTEFTVPCTYDKLGRVVTMLSLTRTSDGKVFKRHYPVLVKYEPIRLELTLPEYRNNFYPGQDYSKIVGTAASAKAVTLTLEGPGIETTVITPDAEGNFTFETPNFEIGEAWLTASIDGYELKKKIRRLAPSDHAMVWISKGNIVVNGKPTLRRNMYASDYRIGTAFQRRYLADDLHETLLFRDPVVHLGPDWLIPGSEGAGGESTKDQMPSEEMLRRIDRVIEANKDRDFAFYYICDEPECRGISPVYLGYVYQYVADKDPYHVVLSASRSPGSQLGIADWFETHPYICPYNHEDGRRTYLRAISSLGGFVDSVAKLNRPDKCIGFLPTCYGGSDGGAAGWDYITFDEYVCHTWAAMIHGGKTLWPYAGHDLNDRAALHEGTRYIFSSFEALEELVLHGERTTLFRSDEAEAVFYDNGEEKMFVLVNFTQQPQTVTLESLTGNWHEFRHNRMISENTFELKPLEVVIGTNVPKDAGLPTFAETVNLIDKLEYDRTHRGSLLFNQHKKIPLTSSGLRGFCRHKLFDGVQDNLAGWVRENPDNFIEMDLTQVKPTFTKLVLRGYHIETAVLKVKNGEEYTVPTAADVKIEEFANTYIFPTPISPDALRFEFDGRVIELYELEVF